MKQMLEKKAKDPLIKYTLYKDKQPPINAVCMVKTADKNGTSNFTIAALKILKNKFDPSKKEIVWVNHNTGKVIGKPNLEDRWFRMSQDKVDEKKIEEMLAKEQFKALKQRIRANSNSKELSNESTVGDEDNVARVGTMVVG